MTTIHVFDPAMCCSTGICGPSVDPRLAHFAADLDWLKTQGLSVERFNLAQQPAAFAEDEFVRSALAAEGEACLPLVKVDGEVKSRGVYPSRAELAAWVGVAAPAPSIVTGAGTEVVALGPVPIPLTAASGGCCTPATVASDELEPANANNRSCC